MLFVAEVEGRAVGFTQLYPTFSSVSMARTFVLNDLFVSPEARKSGVGRGLLSAAAHYAREVGAIRLSRSEEHTSELQSRPHLVCRLLLEKKKKKKNNLKLKKT